MIANRKDGPPSPVDVAPATRDEEPVLDNLLQLYAHDFSEFHHVDLGENGRFVYKNLPRYWTESGRHPFLIRIDSKLAGFVLVKRGSEVSGDEGVWDMAEFFVTRGHRRQGVGSQAAHQVWRRFPGRWEVRVMESNQSAHQFWSRTVSAFAGEEIHPARVEKNGEHWLVFSFESRSS